MELHKIYENVVKARPELGVGLVIEHRIGPFKRTCWWYEPLSLRWYSDTPEGEATATALIESHWLRALPDGSRLEKSLHTGRWLVAWAHDVRFTDSFVDPLHALAEYHVPGSTAEGAGR